jgi:hypothetical protein
MAILEMPPANDRTSRRLWRLARERPATYVIIGLGILGLDLLTGPYLMFPILFVAPVALCAWWSSHRWAYVLAVLLPLGRFWIAGHIEKSVPVPYAELNAAIRVTVLLVIAYLAARTARQTRELQCEVKILEGLLPICRFCKKIHTEREEWESIEEFIAENADVKFKRGICPDCAENHFGSVFARRGDE